jgi:CBS domain-containing protein
MWWPLIGGICVGIGGLVDPRVLGVGYGTIHQLLNGQILGAAAVSLLVAKSIVWSLSLGSGTSGGVLAPLLMMGGALGALAGQFIPVGTPGLWAMIGMAAMMGGTMRSPFTALIFTFELTYDVRALPALLVASIASEMVTVLWLKRSILTEKVARRGHHLTREYAVDPFEVHRVAEIMVTEFPTVEPSTTMRTLGDPEFFAAAWFAERRALPIVDAKQGPIGIVTQGDYLRAMDTPGGLDQTVQQAGSQRLITVDEDEVVRAAVDKLLSANVERLIVVSEEKGGAMTGYLDRAAVLDAHLHLYREENVREQSRGLSAFF